MICAMEGMFSYPTAHTQTSHREQHPHIKCFNERLPLKLLDFPGSLVFFLFILKLNVKCAKLFSFLIKISHCNHHISSNFIRSCHLDIKKQQQDLEVVETGKGMDVFVTLMQMCVCALYFYL